jgi:hypothetical protein
MKDKSSDGRAPKEVNFRTSSRPPSSKSTSLRETFEGPNSELANKAAA